MAQCTPRQDLPPKGGYKAIPFARIPAKTYLGGSTMFAGFLAISAGAAYVFYLGYRAIHRQQIERRSADFALYPMLLAERDREYLKQLRRNRDEEGKLMANVEGWKVGTYYGEPIYKTVPEDTLIEPNYVDYYVHADFKDFAKRAHLSLWS